MKTLIRLFQAGLLLAAILSCESRSPQLRFRGNLLFNRRRNDFRGNSLFTRRRNDFRVNSLFTTRRRDDFRAIGRGLCQASDAPFDFNPDSEIGPDNWGNISVCCDGQFQSPVNLVSSTSSCFSIQTPYYVNARQVTASLSNNGIYPTMSIPPSGGNILRVSRGFNQPSQLFILDSLHVHFASPGVRGSEHLIDGQGFDGEIHLVHYNQVYDSFDTALSKVDGLAVLTIMISAIQGEQNSVFDDLMKSIAQLEGIDNEIAFTFNPLWLLPSSRDLFHYQGSLTTPPCSQSAQFLVFTQPIRVTRQQLETLWSLPSSVAGELISLYSNVRPLQPLNNRVVATNFLC